MNRPTFRWKIKKVVSPLGSLDPMHGAWMITQYREGRVVFAACAHTFAGACRYVEARIGREKLLARQALATASQPEYTRVTPTKGDTP